MAIAPEIVLPRRVILDGAPEPERGSRGHHHLDDLGEEEWYESESEGTLPTAGHHGKPGDSRGEQGYVGHDSGSDISYKGNRTMLSDQACEESHQRIRQQVAACRTEQLRDTANAGRTEHRQSHCTPGQVQQRSS